MDMKKQREHENRLEALRVAAKQFPEPKDAGRLGVAAANLAADVVATAEKYFKFLQGDDAETPSPE